MKILIIAPHPDDEVLGCGGTIKKYGKKGSKVYLCIATKAYTPEWSEEFLRNRPKEIAKANGILGIKKTYFLDFPTVKLDTIPQKELNESILKVIKEINPESIYLPHAGDVHKDHRIIFESVLSMVRPAGENGIKKIISYETLSETDQSRGLKAFIPNIYEDITDEIGIKIEAMKAYKSEIKKYPHPRSLEMIKVLAQKRGSEAGLKFAEAFMLIREIK
jgi:LmbE family N-acetylglucosaminyl deacetylase